MQPGDRNDLTDVAGIRVGQAQRVGDGWLTGTTVVVPPPEGAVAGVDVRGGGPGTRETDLLDPRNLVERLHAVVLTGGSALGLAAADGVARALLAEGTGYPMGPPGEVVPIVPAAVVFDLGRGGVFGNAPDAALGAEAFAAASGSAVALGNQGAGTGARAGGLKGGLGSASVVLDDGTTVAALVAVNCVGSGVDPRTGDLWGAPHLLRGDLGRQLGVAGLRRPAPEDLHAALDAAAALPADRPAVLATTIGVVATDAALTKAQCAKVAGIGHDGLARAVNPVHTMYDGDTLFALSTCDRPAPDPFAFHALLTAAGDCVSRAVVRGLLAAETTTTGWGTMRSYADAFPTALA